MGGQSEPQRPLRILGVSAHPHDWTWFAGTLFLHQRAGDLVTVCCVIHGGATHRERWLDEMNKSPEERDPAIVDEPVESYMAQKQDDMRRAAALFGIEDVRLLGFDDKPFLISEQPQAVERIRDLILEVRPDMLLTENPFGDSGFRMAHRTDHTEVGRAAVEARDRAAAPRASARSPAHRVALTYFAGVMFDPVDQACSGFRGRRSVQPFGPRQVEKRLVD